MRILQLCLRSPFPPADGGTIAMFNMASALKKSGAYVKILAFNTRKHFVDPASMPDQYVSDFHPELVYLDATVKPLPALLSLLTGKSYNVSRFHTRLFKESLEQLLEREEFDIIQMESLFMTPYLEIIRKKSKALIVFRSHNVEYLIWHRLAASEKNKIKKWYLQLLSQRLKNYEAALVNKLDGIVALTEEDKKLYVDMGCTVPLLVAPIGIDVIKYAAGNNSNSFSLVHLGSMDWLPNIEGIDWFIENVYPMLSGVAIKFKLFLAGKNMPARIFKLATNQLQIDGTIDDSKTYLADKQIMIVPLLSGGGMRVKIIEGLAMGKTIISTSVGAEGIRYEKGKNILIADSASDFRDAIIKCLENPAMTFAIGKEARLLAENIYDNSVVGSEIMKFYNRIGAIKLSSITKNS